MVRMAEATIAVLDVARIDTSEAATEALDGRRAVAKAHDVGAASGKDQGRAALGGLLAPFLQVDFSGVGVAVGSHAVTLVAASFLRSASAQNSANVRSVINSLQASTK